MDPILLNTAPLLRNFTKKRFIQAKTIYKDYFRNPDSKEDLKIRLDERGLPDVIQLLERQTISGKKKTEAECIQNLMAEIFRRQTDMVKSVDDSDINKLKFDSLIDALNFVSDFVGTISEAVNEVARQVSLHSVGRGILLQQLNLQYQDTIRMIPSIYAEAGRISNYKAKKLKSKIRSQESIITSLKQNHSDEMQKVNRENFVWQKRQTQKLRMLEQNVVELEHEKDRLLEKNQVLLSQVDDMRRQRIILENELEANENEIEDLKKTNEEINASKDSQRQLINQLHATVDELTKENATQETRTNNSDDDSEDSLDGSSLNQSMESSHKGGGDDETGSIVSSLPTTYMDHLNKRERRLSTLEATYPAARRSSVSSVDSQGIIMSMLESRVPFSLDLNEIDTPLPMFGDGEIQIHDLFEAPFAKLMCWTGIGSLERLLAVKSKKRGKRRKSVISAPKTRGRRSSMAITKASMASKTSTVTDEKPSSMLSLQDLRNRIAHFMQIRLNYVNLLKTKGEVEITPSFWIIIHRSLHIEANGDMLEILRLGHQLLDSAWQHRQVGDISDFIMSLSLAFDECSIDFVQYFLRAMEMCPFGSPFKYYKTLDEPKSITTTSMTKPFRSTSGGVLTSPLSSATTSSTNSSSLSSNESSPKLSKPISLSLVSPPPILSPTIATPDNSNKSTESNNTMNSPTKTLPLSPIKTLLKLKNRIRNRKRWKGVPENISGPRVAITIRTICHVLGFSVKAGVVLEEQCVPIPQENECCEAPLPLSPLNPRTAASQSTLHPQQQYAFFNDASSQNTSSTTYFNPSSPPKRTLSNPNTTSRRANFPSPHGANLDINTPRNPNLPSNINTTPQKASSPPKKGRNKRKSRRSSNKGNANSTLPPSRLPSPEQCADRIISNLRHQCRGLSDKPLECGPMGLPAEVPFELVHQLMSKEFMTQRQYLYNNIRTTLHNQLRISVKGRKDFSKKFGLDVTTVRTMLSNMFNPISDSAIDNIHLRAISASMEPSTTNVSSLMCILESDGLLMGDLKNSIGTIDKFVGEK
eukprot:TRINITY_DN4712_c0_g1_i1.p1 TRINITY_DN4712_c0_g1~~TRINITY_DN4712_c0_g1_i1.p1  ORF type:complete len:1041 (-),score=240.08 TRINITY_DN4712_c0_g1_i1:188-3310(-)